jgi:hypothetical protein
MWRSPTWAAGGLTLYPSFETTWSGLTLYPSFETTWSSE